MQKIFKITWLENDPYITRKNTETALQSWFKSITIKVEEIDLKIIKNEDHEQKELLECDDVCPGCGAVDLSGHDFCDNCEHCLGCCDCCATCGCSEDFCQCPIDDEDK